MSPDLNKKTHLQDPRKQQKYSINSIQQLAQVTPLTANMQVYWISHNWGVATRCPANQKLVRHVSGCTPCCCSLLFVTTVSYLMFFFCNHIIGFYCRLWTTHSVNLKEIISLGLNFSIPVVASRHNFKTHSWKQGWVPEHEPPVCRSVVVLWSLWVFRLRSVTAAGLRWRPAGPHSWEELRRDETRSTWTHRRSIWVTETAAAPTHGLLDFRWRNTPSAHVQHHIIHALFSLTL